MSVLFVAGRIGWHYGIRKGGGVRLKGRLSLLLCIVSSRFFGVVLDIFFSVFPLDAACVCATVFCRVQKIICPDRRHLFQGWWLVLDAAGFGLSTELISNDVELVRDKHFVVVVVNFHLNLILDLSFSMQIGLHSDLIGRY